MQSVSLNLDKNIYIEKVFNFSVYLPWDIFLTTQYPILNRYFIEERLKGSQRSWKIMSDALINQVLSISWIKVLQINTCDHCMLSHEETQNIFCSFVSLIFVEFNASRRQFFVTNSFCRYFSELVQIVFLSYNLLQDILCLYLHGVNQFKSHFILVT